MAVNPFEMTIGIIFAVLWKRWGFHPAKGTLKLNVVDHYQHVLLCTYDVLVVVEESE